MTDLVATESGAIGAEDIRDLQPLPGHDAPALRGLGLAALGWQLFQRTLDRLQFATVDLGIVGGGGELGMAQQHLDQPDIDLLLQQVRGKAVPERCKLTRLSISAASLAP